MALNKVACFVAVLFALTLTLSEVSSLQCYHCLNCTASNIQVVTCALPNITIPTSPPTTTSTTTTTAPTTNTTTTEPVVNTTATGPIETNTTESPVLPPNKFQITRVERSLDDMDELYNNCECSDELCYCDERSMSLTNISFVCITEQNLVNNVQLVNKGCGVKFNTTQNTCQYSGYSADCMVCETDLCNAAMSSHFSAALVIAAAVLSSMQLN